MARSSNCQTEHQNHLLTEQAFLGRRLMGAVGVAREVKVVVVTKETEDGSGWHC